MTFSLPSWPGTLLALILIPAFISLGYWQLERGQQKEQRQMQFSTTGLASGLPQQDQAEDGQQLRLNGSFDTTRHVLADNKIWNTRPGVHVYSVLHTDDGSILINRGWLPLGADRSQLPEIPSPSGEVVVTGRLSDIPGPGRQLGEALDMSPDQWPQLVTYPSLQRISASLDLELYSKVLLLSADSAHGFEGRQWKSVYLGPAKHRGYALQWFALALATLIGWFWFALRGNKGAIET